jgi:putative FmdB family regulatory protein
MPLFDYECPNCGAQTEEFVRNPHEPQSCPNCDTKMQRKWGRFGVRGFPKIPDNWIPKEKGGAYDKNDPYWRGS